MDLVESLYIYALKKDSDRRQATREIALSSYLKMGQNANIREEVDFLMDSIMRVSKATGNLYVKQHASEIEAAYLERIYQSPTWRDIVALV
ncbi:hypothetical protein [Marispirochaeta sp.]|uniref:hypothetical protein n=1 Tax=Marispirochaeta sp. TaxID=2038653 RepID=UPI0029C99ED6|nr:hypothetical protein [Marispirochaeta sp.]